ncbi:MULTISPECIES: hypothetical protein [Flavobacteriaceae]|uniref:hypothetical protein n=1 Tax=Flavobacteriaceae TaxID=49546 RepID=UPI001491E5DE|nr:MULTISPECIES: hypothetical protein [Allomuricauda]MDC6366809.1 hypothetical protein [Muricauda sp. AC10]
MRSIKKQIPNHQGILLVLFMLLISSCKQGAVLEFSVTEPVGISRELEYIELEWRMPKLENKNFVIDNGKGRVPGQIVGIDSTGKDFTIKAIFPIQIEANTTDSYTLYQGNATFADRMVTVDHGNGLSIENKYFLADFTANKPNEGAPLYGGQLKTLHPKDQNDLLFKRKNINMHWAPNFQAKGRPYRTLGHLNNHNAREKVGPLMVTIEKSGSVQDYPEIVLKAKYTFFAGLPFFRFTSEMTMKDEIELFLLRNDEMTLDSLFTHIHFPKGDTIEKLPLYKKNTFHDLKETPIAANAPWLAFSNHVKKYHLGCIRLVYDNHSLSGNDSPLFEPHTKITAVGDGGRYWNRRLINEENTKLPAGSRYYEDNLYFVAGHTDSLTTYITKLKTRMQHPVTITIKKQ